MVVAAACVVVGEGTVTVVGGPVGVDGVVGETRGVFLGAVPPGVGGLVAAGKVAVDPGAGAVVNVGGFGAPPDGTEVDGLDVEGLEAAGTVVGSEESTG